MPYPNLISRVIYFTFLFSVASSTEITHLSFNQLVTLENMILPEIDSLDDGMLPVHDPTNDFSSDCVKSRTCVTYFCVIVKAPESPVCLTLGSCKHCIDWFCVCFLASNVFLIACYLCCRKHTAQYKPLS